MISHRSASFIIIALLIAGFAIWGPAGMKALFVPKGFFFVDNNPASIVIPEEGMVTSNTTAAFPGIGPVAREIGTFEFGATKELGFDINCAATPTYMTARTDSELKLYNRVDVRRTINIGPKVYTLRPNTTITVVANDEGTWKVYCDGYDSGATIAIGN